MVHSIRESAVYAKPEKVKKYTDGKVVFDTYLQEAEETNQNQRVYPKVVIDNGLKRITEKIQDRAFIGELDHPISDDQVRQTTVLYKESSHVIRDWGWEGNLLKATVETLPYTENGKTLSGLILDRIKVGFSLRGLADIQDNGQHQQILDPLLIITYDAVSEPSNVRATIQEVRHEAVSIVKESKNMICTSDGKCYLPDYFDQLIESKLINLKKKYW